MSYIAGKQEKIVTRGLVYAIDGIDHGTFPGNGSSSTTYKSLAGSKNLTMQSTVTHRYHKSGILSFNGTTDYLSGSDSGFPSGASARTVGFWFRPLDFTDNWGAILTYGTTTAYQGFGITWNDTSHNILVGRYGGNSAANSTTIEMDRWHYMTVVFDGSSTIKFFLNASADGTATLSSINTQLSGNFTIGNGMSGWDSGYFRGQIGPFHIYNRELSTTEITQNYNLWKSRFQPDTESSVITTNRVFHIDAGNTNSYGGSGTSITDLAGTQNATITSGNPFSSDDGGAFNLRGDSEDASITATNHADLRITGDITADIWVNFDATNIDNVNLIAHNASGESSQANYLYWMNWKTTSGGSIRYGHEYGSGTNKVNTVAVTVETGRWYNFCMIRDHSGAIGTARTWYLFQDGVQIDSFTYTSSQDASGGSNSFTHIGSNIDGNDLNGKISSVRIYNTPLSLSQLRSNYNATAPRFKSGIDTGIVDTTTTLDRTDCVLELDPSSPVCYYGGGSDVKDLAGGPTDGTLVNATYNSSYGGVWDFDGNGDIIQLRHKNFARFRQFDSQSDGDDITIMAWVLVHSDVTEHRPATNSGMWFSTLEESNVGGTQGTGMHLSWADDSYVGSGYDSVLLCRIGQTPSSGWSGGHQYRSNGNTFPKNTWKHIVVTFEGATSSGKTSKAYFDGSETTWTKYQDGPGTNQPIPYLRSTGTVAQCNLGGALTQRGDGLFLSGRSSSYFKGSIGYFATFRRALSATEILNHYNATKSRFGL